MNDTPRVYIIQDLGRIDFAPAELYGEPVVLIEGRVSHASLKRTFGRMRDKLRGMKRDDWIVPCGHPALIACAGAIMSEKCGVIRILAWDNQEQRYIPAEVQTA